MLSHKHKLRPIISIGAGGHFRSASGFICESGYFVEEAINFNSSDSLSSLKKYINDIKSRFSLKNLNFVICIGDNKRRSEIYHYLKENVGIENCQFPNIVSQNAKLSHFIKIGIGNIIFPGVVINRGVNLSNFIILNTQCSIDHDCIIDNYVSVAPGAILGGSVLVGKSSMIGIGAVVKNNISIGSECLLGGNAFLNVNMPNNSLYYGVPAKKISVI